MQKNTSIIIAVIMLVVGLGIGYGVGNNEIPDKASNQSIHGKHMMPDGSMMSNDGSMLNMMMDMNASLEGKTGDEFDKAFISEMIIHHEGAVDMAELALTNAKHQEIKDLANAIISAQNKEIADMKGWQNNWYLR